MSITTERKDMLVFCSTRQDLQRLALSCAGFRRYLVQSTKVTTNKVVDVLVKPFCIPFTVKGVVSNYLGFHVNCTTEFFCVHTKILNTLPANVRGFVRNDVEILRAGNAGYNFCPRILVALFS